MDVKPYDLPEPSLKEWLLWLLRRRLRLQISGVSMQPTLCPGDLVLVDPNAYRRDPPQAGEIVVAWHPYQSDLQIIKRVETLTSSGQVILLSDNPLAGTDSRQFGAVLPEHVIGRVTCRSQSSSP